MNRQQHLGLMYSERRGYQGKLASLVIFLSLCLIVSIYQYQKLQNLQILDSVKASSVNLMPIKNNTNSIIVLLANYRDSKRCSETLMSIFDNAVYPDNIVVSVHDQIYKDEINCLDLYCKERSDCRKSQIRTSQIDAGDAKGPTVARYMTEEMIEDEEYCLTVDSHSRFVKDWDTRVIAQWKSIDNPNAVLSAYPKSVDTMNNGDTSVNHMCYSHIESDVPDAMIEYGPLITEPKGDKPRLCSQLAGGFSFGGCQQAVEVRNDPYTPFLFHGEEYSRAARLWTAGYDLYCPNEDIVYHWYETRKVIWERDWNLRFVVQQRSQRRIRHMLGINISSNDFDLTNMEKFALGKKRTFEQWKVFSSIEPTDRFIGKINQRQFNACRDLEFVPYAS